MIHCCVMYDRQPPWSITRSHHDASAAMHGNNLEPMNKQINNTTTLSVGGLLFEMRVKMCRKGGRAFGYFLAGKSGMGFRVPNPDMVPLCSNS